MNLSLQITNISDIIILSKDNKANAGKDEYGRNDYT